MHTLEDNDMSGMDSKIAKLLAMAEHPNSNPEEAANAAAMAAALAAKYNIDLDSVRRVEDTKTFRQDRSGWHTRYRDAEAVSLMGSWVGRVFGCKLIIHTFRRSQSWYSFTGQPHNTQLAHSWLEYLWTSCKRANTEHARLSNYGDKDIRQQARDNFRIHYAAAVARRLKQRFDAMQTDGVSGSTALVVAAWFDQERKEVELWMEQNGEAAPPLKPRDVKLMLDAALAGKRAGEKVGLHDQIAAGATTTKRLT